VRQFAIFTEGLTEQVFVRQILLKVVDNSKLKFVCMKLAASGNETPVPWDYSAPEPELYFLILDCGGDGKVLSAIGEREKRLIDKGYEKIIGIRDMYSKEYCERSPKIIDSTVIASLIRNWNRTIREMANADRITFHISIMEVEAWFLAMYNLFHKIDSRLSLDFIETNLGFNLQTDDPEKKFYKPSNQVKDIMRLCGRRYTKKRAEVEAITSRMEVQDFTNATENCRCSSFGFFYSDIASCTLIV